MTPEDLLLEALEIVSGWYLDPEDWTQAVNDQARLMAGTYLDDTCPDFPPSAYTALNF